VEGLPPGRYLFAVYRTCLHCTRDLHSNDVLETLPIGRRVAFDAAQGRLWVICRSCGKWNLVPFDTRLETIDACERIFRDTRTRYSTDNIGLARVSEGLELVRIGAPQRPEFASWRYGAQYRKRRRVNLAMGGAGSAASFVATQYLAHLGSAASEAFFLSVGVMIPAALLPTFVWSALRGRMQRIVTTIPGVATPVHLEATATSTAHLSLVDGEMSVSWNPSWIASFRKQRMEVTGFEARLLARRILGVVNRNVGSKWEMATAIERMERGNIEVWLSQLSRRSIAWKQSSVLDRFRVGSSEVLRSMDAPKQPIAYGGFEANGFALVSLARADRLAIEMWLSEDDEARALGGELALLERQWREAEELAAIADRLAVPELSP
jgi:hypothetical protein